MNTSQSNPAPTLEWRDHLILTCLGAVLLGVLISFMLPVQYPFANDTTGYLQEAQNWLHGEGLLRGTGWSDTARDFSVFPLYPPGFSLVIGGLSQLGLSLPHAALTASWLAWLLLLPAIAYTLRPLVGRWSAMVVAVLAVSSPGFVEWGYLALSDAGMTLFSVLSLGILLRQDCSRNGNWHAILLSGLLAGCAYSLRNAAAVLPLTVIAYLGVSVLTKQSGWRATFRTGLLWGAGFAMLACPIFLYNFQTFGSIQPYFSEHGGTDFGVLKAFRVSLWSFLLDISAWRTVANIAWSAMAMALLLFPLVLLLLWMGWKRWQHRMETSRAALLLLLLYMSIGFAMVVWGRSRFDWVEVTLTRQLLPYSWAALAVTVWAVRPSSMEANFWTHGMARVLLLAGLILVAGRVDSIWTDLQRERNIQATVDANGYAAAAAQLPGVVLTNRIKQNTSRDRALIDLLKSLPDNAHILSNHGPLLSLESGRHIRSFDPNPENLTALTTIRPHLNDKALILAILPTNSMLRSTEANVWQDNTLRRIGLGHEILLRTPSALVVRLP